MIFSCSYCRQRFDVPEHWKGRTINCTHCGEHIVVPAESEKEVPAPPSSDQGAPPDNQAAPSFNQGGPPEKQGAPPDNQGPPPDNQGAPSSNRGAPPDNQGAPSSGQGTPPSNQGAPRNAPPPRPPPVAPPSPPPPRPRGIPLALLLPGYTLLLAVGVFGYVAARNQESPQQTWHRFAALIGEPPRPAATPAPFPSPTTPPKPVTASTPAPARTPLLPAAAPTPDALAWLAGHKDRWPKEVTLREKEDFPAVFEDKVVGSVAVPAGTAVAVSGIASGEITVVSPGGGSRRLAPGATNLPELARIEMARPEPSTSTPPSSPTPLAVPQMAGTPRPAAPDAPSESTSPPESAPALASESTPKPEPTPYTNYFGMSVEPQARAADDADKASPAATPPAAPFPTADARTAMTVSEPTQMADPLSNRRVVLTGSGTLRLTAPGDPLPGSVVNLASPDAWLLLEKVPAATALSDFLNRLWVNGVSAAPGVNVRITRYGSGCAVIPHGADFAAMQVFGAEGCGGAARPLRCGVRYDAQSLGVPDTAIRSFRLKRGYMATIAQEENGTGISKNYVAQDHDLEVRQLPAGLDGAVHFVRVFPWRWTSKKGVAGDIFQNLNVGWYYDWNISHASTPDLEYTPIRQNRWWPPLNQDWLARGSTHLLGYNEPDHKDQSNLTVDAALAGWPDLLATGLRLGSPAVSDGGLGWLFDFIAKADAAHLRVDFVAVHYYRAVNNPSDAHGAAANFYNFLKGIHDRTRRPIWVTEWNNGANWTGHKPTYEQETAAVTEMVRMLDRTPFVERYAVYNWVQDERNVQRKDGTLTGAGEVYRDDVSPPSYSQSNP